MVKAGLISGAVMFVIVFASAFLISPLCALCAPWLIGLLAGYLTGVFEKPAADQANRRGATAGAIAGAIGIPGSMIAAVINAAVLQDPNNQVVSEMFDLPAASPAMVWAVQLGLSLCIGLLNTGFAALMGLAGASLWSNTTGKTPSPPAPVP
jgi:hypothetical protein